MKNISDDIAVLLITKCSDNKVYKCLSSLSLCDCVKQLRLYVMYTGNDANDISQLDNAMSTLGIQRRIVQGTYHFARNVNELSRLGNEKYILCINDDVELISKDSISHCLSVLDANERFGTVGIKLLFEDNTIQHAGHLLLLKNNSFYAITHYLIRQPNQQLPDYISVGNTFAFCIFRRSDFVICGGLNEEYKKCFEDVEFNWKMLMNDKVNVTAGSMSAYHYESTTRKQQDCLVERTDINTLLAFFKQNKSKILQNANILRTILNI